MILLSKRVLVGLNLTLSVRAITKQQFPKYFRVVQYLIHRAHRKYGYDVTHSGYSHTLYEAALDGEPFGWFYMKTITRRQRAWAKESWVGVHPLTKYTANSKFDFHKLGRGSRDLARIQLWNALRDYLFDNNLADYLRESVVLATVEQTRHVLEPLRYAGIICAGAEYLRPTELRKKLSEMIHNGKVVFFSIHPKHSIMFKTFSSANVKQAHRNHGWEWDKQAQAYFTIADTLRQFPLSNVDAQRIAFSKALKRI